MYDTSKQQCDIIALHHKRSTLEVYWVCVFVHTMGVPNDSNPPPEAFSAIGTLAVFGFVSIIVYLFILKPFALSGRRDAGTARVNANATQTAGAVPAAVSTRASSEPAVWPSATRKPPHASKTDALLIDGMVSFRHSTAATYDATATDADMVAKNRKDRAKILSRILTLELGAAPPPRGGCVVVSIPADDVDCVKLRRILFLLATYFTLVVVISVEQSTTDDEIKQLVAKVRGSDESIIPEVVLPSHRIVAAQSRTGRIALVRQLGSVEFVLDHEMEMQNELERFGFKVFIYGSAVQGPESSLLAAYLMF